MDLEQNTLINELNQGKELAKQLMNHILQPSSSQETRDFLVGRILSSYEKALSMLKTTEKDKSKSLQTPHSLDNTSLRSVIFDQADSKHSDVFKKRKVLPRWTEQVKVCMGTGPEGPLEDGYSWRKYGQKDILGANYPRGYYRCTHRNAQGCLATKQVQRSDEDPSLFEVTYRGRHTCSRASQLAKTSIPLIFKQDLKEEEENHFPRHNQEEGGEEKRPKKSQIPTDLEVKTEDLDTNEDHDHHIFHPFSFPSTPIESENVGGDFFSDMVENGFTGSFSPPFISPVGSESNSLSVLPWHNMSSFGLANINTSESDLTAEILSTPNSVTNSPIKDLEYLTLDKVDIEIEFSF